MSLILVRHGETPLNVARVLQPPDTPLSANGIRQAQAVGTRLGQLGLAGILSSDLPRAYMTAQAIAATTGLPIETTPLLHERNFGALRGQPYDGLGYDPISMEAAPPGGESMQQFRDRCAQAFALAVERQRPLGSGRLAVVTHGLVIRVIVEAHLKLQEGQVIPLRIANTSVTIVSPQPPHMIELLDCIRHLDLDAAEAKDSLSGG